MPRWAGIVGTAALAAAVGALMMASAAGALGAAQGAAEPAPGETAAPAPAPSGGTGARALPDLREYLPAWAHHEMSGVAVWQFLMAFALLLAGLVLKKVSDFLFEKKLIPLLEKTPLQFDNRLASAAGKPFGFLVLLGGVAGAMWVLCLPEEPADIRGLVFSGLKVLLAADVMWFLFRLVDVLAVYLASLAGRTESRLDDQLVPLIRKALKLTIGIVLAVWVVQLLGYSVSSLLAGLGIGGLAVALALQDTLSNFFGSIFIFLDRPFVVGDMVKIGDVEGTVEQIGFRTTRIRTWPATLVCMPNKTVASAIVDNWSKMPKRRVTQTVGVTYETTADQMEQALAAVRKILQADEGIDPEFIVVAFDEFCASSLDIRIVYFTKSIAYLDHMATRQRVNLAVMRALKDLGLSIAFPTRTVYFEGDVARDLASRRGPDGGDGRPGAG